MLQPNLLTIEDLSVAFAGAGDTDTLVLDRVSLQLKPGARLGLVGESGCGKSTLCRAIVRTLRAPAYIAGGEVYWQGQSLFARSPEALNKVRWKEIAIVVQSALDALNPVLTVEAQILDVLRAHGRSQGSSKRLQELMRLVGLEPRHLKSYAFELSGGMRQRVVIAMALALEPQLLIMDEPTTALDVVTQAEILGHILALQEELGFAILLVTHDLPLALDFCQEIAVMYAGRIVEQGPSERLVRQPKHPYTAGLLQCFPLPGQKKTVLHGVLGDPASFAHLPSGCPFHPRCDRAEAICTQERPLLEQRGEGSYACYRPLPDLPQEHPLSYGDSLSFPTRPATPLEEAPLL